MSILGKFFKEKGNFIVIRQVEIKEVPKMFNKDSISFGEFRQRVSGAPLNLNKQEADKLTKALEENKTADVNRGKGRILFR